MAKQKYQRIIKKKLYNYTYQDIPSKIIEFGDGCNLTYIYHTKGIFQGVHVAQKYSEA